MNDTARSPLVRTLRVECPIDHAFRTFTAGIDLWWPQSHRRFERSRISLEATPGGRFTELAEEGKEALLGNVVHCEPPRRISYTWYPGAITGPTLVDVRFADEGTHTLVEITHSEGESGLGDAWPERVARFAGAWDQVLPAFAAQAGGERKREGDKETGREGDGKRG